MRRRSSQITTLIMIGLAATAASASLDEKVNAVFAEYDTTHSPGVAVAVLKEGEVVFKQGYGMANLEYGIPVTPSTIFHVASVSKQFTTFAVVLLAQEGKLSLDDDVREYVQEVPAFGPTITIRHLIHHTSGLRDQWDLLSLSHWRMDDVITQDDILRLVSRQKDLNFEPGSRYMYCNTGYTLLAVIVERVSKKSLDEYCQENIFQPLGMTNTHFHDDHEHIVKNRAYSYSRKGAGGYQKAVLSFAVAGATSLFTTVEDLLRWQKNFDTIQVGGNSAIEKMLGRTTLNSGEEIDYGFALVHESHAGLRTISHSGSDAGFRSFLVRFPDHDISIAVMGNLGSLNTGRLGYEVADLYLEDHIETDDEATASVEGSVEEEPDFVDVPEATLKPYVGAYFSEAIPLTLRLTYDEGSLNVVQGDRVRTLGADSPVLFRWRANPDLFTLEIMKDDHGKVTEIEIEQGGETVVLARTESEEILIEHLEQFVGAYYSEELDVTNTIYLDEGRLRVERHKRSPLPMIPTLNGAFRAGRASLRFTRDGDGTVNGALLNTGRTLNLRFDKVE